MHGYPSRVRVGRGSDEIDQSSTHARLIQHEDYAYDALKLKKEEFTQMTKLPFTLLFLLRSMLVFIFLYLNV